jgi:DNA-binding NtrC family response regulator
MVSQLANGGSMPLGTPSTQIISHPSAQPLPQDDDFVTPEIIEDETVSLEDRERRAILRALEHNQGNRKQAAADLHISERTLYRKLKGYNIVD